MPLRHHPSAKFKIPSAPPDLVRRPRLLNFLHENINRKLLLVSAAAGYGKSSLIADFARDTDYPVAWCWLDEGDADVVALTDDLVQALQQTFPAYQSSLPALASQRGTNPDDLAAVLAREIAESIDEYFVLILDDFHLVQGSDAILRFFDSLLTALPEQAHLVLSGRSVPPLRVFSSLAAKQGVAGLSEEHLRFNADEVKELVRFRQRDRLSDAEVERLVSDSEGWITGILLTTQLLWQGMMADLVQTRRAEGPLYDYLAQEILDRQPEPLRTFLMESAVLPEMEPPVCDAILGRTNSAELLRQAEARRLFVTSIGEEFRAYQYHNLFREFLLSQLKARSPRRLKALQFSAAEWYASQGMAEAAVTFFTLAGDLEKAVQVAEAEAQALFKTGRYATLQRWAEQLAPLAGRAPNLHFYLATVQGDRGQLAAAEQTLEVAAAGFAARSDRNGCLRASLHRSWLAYQRGDFKRGLELALAALPEARELDPPAVTALALRYVGLCQFALGQLPAAEQSLLEAASLLNATQEWYDQAWLLNDLALVQRKRGETARAAHAQREALAIWRDHEAVGPLALGLNNVAWDMHMLGQYEVARDTYAEAMEWARRAGSARTEALITAGQADVDFDLGQWSAAAELYRKALSKAEQIGDWALAAYLFRGMARLDRAAGRFAAALEWLRRAELASKQGQSRSPLANLDGLRGIVLVEMGRVTEGRQVLQEACAALEKVGALVDLAQTLLLRACAEYRDGDEAAAEASLTRAFEIADKVGYEQMLVSEAQSARDVLQVFADRLRLGVRVRSLMARTLARGPAGETRLWETAPAASVGIAATTTRLEVHALGPSRVFKDGHEIPRSAWVSQRTRELFFYMADRAPVARNQLLDTFWPNMPPPRAAANLYQTLYRLRKAIGDGVVKLADQVCEFAPGVVMAYDAARFEACALAALSLEPEDTKRLGELESAIQMYTGDYLADLSIEWGRERRDELSSLHVLLLRDYSDELMNLTRYVEARAALERALAAEPLRDELHRRMLVCLAKLGRRYEVVNHYRRYRDLVRTELGLDPPEDIAQLYGRLIQ